MEKLTGHGRPSSHLIGEVNQHYEDLDTGDIYECRVASQYSPLHGAPVGGYQWELRFKGEDIQDSAQYLSSGSGVTSWNDLTDKPFYDESPVLYNGYPEYAFFSAKLSDVHLRAGVEYIVAYERDGVQVCSYFTAQEDNGNVTIDNTDDIGGNGFVLTYNPDDDCTYFMPKSGVFMEGCPEFDDMGAYAYTSTVKLHISYMHSEDAGVKTIDPKYLPTGGATSWNDLKDKPFDVKTTKLIIIPSASIEANGEYFYEDGSIHGIDEGHTYYATINGTTVSAIATRQGEEFNEYNCLKFSSPDGSCRVEYYGGTVVKIYSLVEYEISVEIFGYQYEDLKTIDSVFLPKAHLAFREVYDEVTKNEFNALLKALREAGYLAE
jgi:hypothetical protein